MKVNEIDYNISLQEEMTFQPITEIMKICKLIESNRSRVLYRKISQKLYKICRKIPVQGLFIIKKKLQ